MDSLGISRLDGKTAALEERTGQYAISVYGYVKAVAAVYCVQNDVEEIPVEAALEHLQQRILQLHDSMDWRCNVAKRIAEIETGVR